MLEKTISKLLTKKHLTIAIAESCTGGLVSHRLTNVSGSSGYFVLGIVAYSNESKAGVLGVSAVSLATHGAVSRQVALEMAEGIRRLADVDIGIGITGIAGPKGGTKRKPVGLVYVSLVRGKKRIVKEYKFNGSREDIKFQASEAVLELIKKYCLSIKRLSEYQATR